MDAIVTVRGRQSEWLVRCDLRQSQIANMRSDGVDVVEVRWHVPAWVANLGMTRPWCIVQDVLNFRNPMR